MPPLRDAETIAKFRLAFEERNSGGVLWKKLAAHWVRKNLDGCNRFTVDSLIYNHIVDCGEIDEVQETREDYRHLHKCHYDFRISIRARRIYIETVLSEGRMGPTVTVVNIHDA